MQFKLKVIHGVLKNAGGDDAFQEIEVAGPRFVIGTAPDCHMRCSGQSIAPHHCVISVERDRVVLHGSNPDLPTFVNESPIASAACLFDGDRVRIGRLQFGVTLDRAKEARPRASSVAAPTQIPSPPPIPAACSSANGGIEDYVAELLSEEDEADRARRRYDPAAREFRPPPAAAASDEPVRILKGAPPKRPPVGLPPKPDIRGADSVDAAHQALNKIISPTKK